MLSILKAKNPYEQPAREVYTSIVQAIREPVFYSEYSVPDTLDGRFDLMLLHIFMVVQQILSVDNKDAEEFNQALFDITFADMDQSFREMGIGDMGIPKHMRRMMKAFNGRMHAYQAALENNTLQDSLRNNLYGTVEDVAADTLKNMESYIQREIKRLQAEGSEPLFNGNVEFKTP